MPSEEELEEIVKTAKKLRTDFHSDLGRNTQSDVEAFEKLIQYSIDHNLEPESFEMDVHLFAHHISSSSVFRRFQLMEKLRNINTITKIVLTRRLILEAKSEVTVQAMMTAPEDVRPFDCKAMFKKKKLPFAMACGYNREGSLGVKFDSNSYSRRFEKVQLEGTIKNVYMGPAHTIFQMNNGEFYGAGTAKNFMENSDDKRLFHSIPIQLKYMNGSKEANLKDDACILDSISTTFFNFKKDHKLIIGDKSWTLVKGSRQVVDPNAKVKVTVGVGPNKKHVIIDPINNTFEKEGEDGIHPIVFFLCGNRLEIPESAKVKYCRGGDVWICHEGTLYNGRWKFAPEAHKTESIGEDVLLASMREMPLEYYVDEFAVREQECSVIVYSPEEEKENVDMKKLTCINMNMNQDFLTRTNIASLNPPLDRDSFDKLLSKNWYGNMYDFAGFPSLAGRQSLPYGLAIVHFTEFDEESDLPIQFKKAFEEMNAGSERDSLYLLNSTLRKFLSKFMILKPIVVEAGWALEDREARNQQITRIFSESYANLQQNLDRALNKLEDLPLIYQRTALGENYKRLLQKLKFNAAYYFVRFNQKDFAWEPRGVSNVSKSVESEVKHRLQTKDINDNDEKYKLIRVEATSDIKSCFCRTQPFVCSTTISHVKVIRKSLLEHIKNGVLNLNLYAYHIFEMKSIEEANEVFKELVDVFFVLSESKTPKIEEFMSKPLDYFTVDELYTFETTDGDVLVPKIFIEIHSDGFDMARKRNAEREGKDPNRIETDASSYIIEKLVYGLIDSRIIQNESVRNLYEVLEIAQYWLLTGIQSQLIFMIVQKITKDDVDILHNLFLVHHDEIVTLVAKYRPEILIYWKEFPIPGIYWKTLKLIIDKIEKKEVKIPLPLLKYSKKSKVKIDRTWLETNFLDAEADDELKKDFMKYVTKSQGYTNSAPTLRTSKRLHSNISK